MTRPGSMPPRLTARPRRRLAIPLTPLIDVVFILLVFFMLASSFVEWRALRLSAAPPGAGATAPSNAILVEITRAGPRLSGEAVSEAELVARLASHAGDTPPQVRVRPSPGVDTQRLVSLLDAISAAGIRDIVLMPGEG